MDSIDSLHAQILDKAFEWAAHVEAETQLNERAMQSNVQHRAAAAINLQEIRVLCKQVRKQEEREQRLVMGKVPGVDIEDTQYFCSVHNSYHTKGVNYS